MYALNFFSLKYYSNDDFLCNIKNSEIRNKGSENLTRNIKNNNKNL